MLPHAGLVLLLAAVPMREPATRLVFGRCLGNQASLLAPYFYFIRNHMEHFRQTPETCEEQANYDFAMITSVLQQYKIGLLSEPEARHKLIMWAMHGIWDEYEPQAPTKPEPRPHSRRSA